MRNRLVPFIITLGICINTLLSLIILLKNTIVYYPDAARDFLLMREIITNNPIMLIGERTGVSGVFHGPLWLYVNLPAFVIGKGNPVIMGWFWFVLFVLLLVGVFVTTKRLFSDIAAFIATFIVSGMYGYHVSFMYNPHGAIVVTPLFFYFFIEFVRKHTAKLALISFFFLGLIFQFEMAFALPIIFLACIICLVTSIKVKNLKLMMSAALGLLPGLSTFILFDTTHHFAQLKSFVSFVVTSTGERPHFTYGWFLSDRLRLALTDGMHDFTGGNIFLSVGVLSLFVWYLIRGKRKTNEYSALQVFIIFYFGFWIITLAYGGMMWPFYHWPLALMAIILFSGIVSKINTRYVLLILVPILINVVLLQANYVHQAYTFQESSLSSWKLHSMVAKKIAQQAKGDYGYFVFNTDLVGYTSRYAIEYWADAYKIHAYYNTKLHTTFLVEQPVADTRLNFQWWQKNMVHISTKPRNISRFPSGINVYQYHLTKNNLLMSPDPGLSNNLLFR